MDEKNILAIMESPFVLGLHRTFKDNKFVYLLTDAYLGGDYGVRFMSKAHLTIQLVASTLHVSSKHSITCTSDTIVIAI